MEGNSDVGDQNGNINNNINQNGNINNNINDNNNHNINNNANQININVNLVNRGNLSSIWNDRRLQKTCFVVVVVAVTWFMGWGYYSITGTLAILVIILDELRQQREQNHRREAQNGVRVCGDVSTVTLQDFLEYRELVNYQRQTVNLQALRREHWNDRSTVTMKVFLEQRSREEFLQWWHQRYPDIQWSECDGDIQSFERYGDIQESDGPSTTPNH